MHREELEVLKLLVVSPVNSPVASQEVSLRVPAWRRLIKGQEDANGMQMTITCKHIVQLQIFTVTKIYFLFKKFKNPSRCHKRYRLYRNSSISVHKVFGLTRLYTFYDSYKEV
jgi:hypothetical protein